MACQEDDTIDSLISSYCIEQGVRHRKDYILRTSTNELLPITSKIAVCGLENGETLYLTTKGEFAKSTDQKSCWYQPQSQYSTKLHFGKILISTLQW